MGGMTPGIAQFPSVFLEVGKECVLVIRTKSICSTTGMSFLPLTQTAVAKIRKIATSELSRTRLLIFRTTPMKLHLLSPRFDAWFICDLEYAVESFTRKS